MLLGKMTWMLGSGQVRSLGRIQHDNPPPTRRHRRGQMLEPEPREPLTVLHNDDRNGRVRQEFGELAAVSVHARPDLGHDPCPPRSSFWSAEDTRQYAATMPPTGTGFGSGSTGINRTARRAGPGSFPSRSRD